VGLGHVGIIFGIEVSRLARNNADWYQLLDLCALTNTLIADSDGVYHPGDFNDRLVLGLKGTMSGNWSGPQDCVTRCQAVSGQPGAALGEGGEGCGEVDAVFGGGGEVAADRADLLGSGEGSQAAGDLLPQLDHPDLPLRRIVGVIPTSEGYSQAAKK
jgi:hypothetical protein